MNIICFENTPQYIQLIERYYPGFRAMFEMSIARYATANQMLNDIIQIVGYICDDSSENIFNANMPNDEVGKYLHISIIAHEIFDYLMAILHYSHSKIDYSNKVAECAGTIHDIEEGTVNQYRLNRAFYDSYDFVDIEDKGKDRFMYTEKLRNGEKGFYHEIVKQVRTENPDVDEAFIPFMVADVLKEAYEIEEDENV